MGTAAARWLCGIDPLVGCSIRLDGLPGKFRCAADAVKAGLFLVPEDRKGMGLLLDMLITENITLPNLPAYTRGVVVSREKERLRAEKSRKELDIRTPGVMVRASSLSGGNQQKIVLAKWLAMKPRAKVFAEPTRGIDVGAKSDRNGGV